MGASFFQDSNPTPAALDTVSELIAQATAAANLAITQANTATTQASTATTEAGVATTQAGLAATSATNAATSDTNAAGSASAAANSATAAATSATNASTSATNASNSASAAATSATNASGSATAASNSASAAATSASNAHTSETNAANSATAAANSAAQAAAAGNPGTNTPTMDGAGTAGVATTLSRSDHQHPTDTSRAPVASPTFTGTPAAPTPAVDTNTTQIPTTAWVLGQVSSSNPAMNGTAATGTSTRFAKSDHVHPTDTSRAPLASPTFTGSPKAPTPASGDNSTNLATTAFSAAYTLRADLTQTFTAAQVQTLLSNIASGLRGFISGLVLSNDTTTPASVLDIQTGNAMSDDNTAMMILATAFTKNCNAAWAAGTGNGALDSGSALAASTWYYPYLIMRPDTGATDILLSASPTTPTLPTNYTKKRRLGAIKTNGSSQIYAFTQIGDTFRWSTPFTDVSTTAQGTTATLYSLSVPSGLIVSALIRGNVYAASSQNVIIITSPQDAIQATTSYTTGNHTVLNVVSGVPQYFGEILLPTNTAGQVRVVASAASTSVNIATVGWTDTRGK